MDTHNLRRQEEEACVTSCGSAVSPFWEQKAGHLRVLSPWAWQRPTAESQSTPGLCCWLSPSNQTQRSINTVTEHATMLLLVLGRKDPELYHRSVADYEGPQRPGEAQTQQHIKYVATDGVGHGHVTHSWNHWYGASQIIWHLHLHLCH